MPGSAAPPPPSPPASVANRPPPSWPDELGASVDEVLEALELRSAYRPTSINAPIDADGTTTDPPAADESDGIDPAIDSMLVRELLGHLDGRQRMIVYLRFFGQLSQSEIAERVGISQVHVSRLLRSSMTTLRGLLDDRR